MSAIGATVQIIVALLIVAALFVTGFAIYNYEEIKAIREMGVQRKRVSIFEGVKDLALTGNGEVYNTMDKSSATYRNLELATNQKGGAEYTYNFWLYIKDSVYQDPADKTESKKTDPGLSTDDLILLVRGDKQYKEYKNLCNVNKIDIIVKSPLVKLQRGGDVLSVEFNTVGSPDIATAGSRKRCGENSKDWNYMNAHKVAVKGLSKKQNLKSRWFMVTVVIQDTNPVDAWPARNRCRARIYVNGTLELDEYVDGSLEMTAGTTYSILQQNSGPLSVAPVVDLPQKTINGISTQQTTKKITGEKNVMMADLTYFNYATDGDELKQIFTAGFVKKQAPALGATDKPFVDTTMDSLSSFSDNAQLNVISRMA